jgi:hypothetical protein
LDKRAGGACKNAELESQDRSHKSRRFSAETYFKIVANPMSSSKVRVCSKSIEDEWFQKAKKKTGLYKLLDDHIHCKGLTELHTHLMGMGSADFWVSKIIETYLPRAESSIKTASSKVWYPWDEILKASGFEPMHGFMGELSESLAESVIFDGFPSYTLAGVIVEEFATLKAKPGDNKARAAPRQRVRCISNQTIVTMLQYEDSRTNRSGPFRALVRNWFEFLSSAGESVMHTEVLHQCKSGNIFRTMHPYSKRGHHYCYISRPRKILPRVLSASLYNERSDCKQVPGSARYPAELCVRTVREGRGELHRVLGQLWGSAERS